VQTPLNAYGFQKIKSYFLLLCIYHENKFRSRRRQLPLEASTRWLAGARPDLNHIWPVWLFVCCSETNDVNTGLLIEVWNKGMIWDRALGYYYMPLTEVRYSNEVW